MPVDYSGTHAVARLDLGVAMMEHIQEMEDFITPQVAPTFRTVRQAAKYSAVTRESLLGDRDVKRGADGKYNRTSIGAKDKGYSCVESGQEVPLSDDEKAKYAKDFDAELVSTAAVTNIIVREQEKRTAALLFDTAVWTGAALFKDYSGAPWDTVGSDVIGQIEFGKDKVRVNCGMMPNTLIFSETNFGRLKVNTAIKDSVKYVARATEEEIKNALADIFGVKKIVIARAVRNSADEGQTYVGADVWSDDYAMLAVVPDNGQDLSQPAVARTFLWTEDSPTDVVVESYRDETARSQVIRARQNTDEQVVDEYFGFLLKVDA